MDNIKTIVTQALREELSNLQLQQKEWLSEDEVRAMYNLSRGTLRGYREDSDNPLPYCRKDKKFFYHRSHLNAFFASHMVGLSKAEAKRFKENVSKL